MQQMSEVIKPPRTPWGIFPEVLIHASESAVKQHPAYKAAKSGDDGAAAELVLATFNLNQAMDLKRIAGDRTPTLVSARLQDELNQLATQDSLTQLPNRRFLLERLKHGIDVERRDGKQTSRSQYQ